jgi:hypothetical protein
MPCDYSRYPPDWPVLRAQVMARAAGHCEGSPRYPDCRAENYKPHPVTGSKVVLTVGHLDHNPRTRDPLKMRAWCQRCHTTYDIEFHARNRRKTLWRRKAWAAVTAFLARPADERQRMLF